MTPLHLAAANGHVDVSTILIDLCCNVNSQNHVSNTGNNFYDVKSVSFGIITNIIKYCFVNQQILLVYVHCMTVLVWLVFIGTVYIAADTDTLAHVLYTLRLP